jgi:DNA-binding MarR family transcriptional regulator
VQQSGRLQPVRLILETLDFERQSALGFDNLKRHTISKNQVFLDAFKGEDIHLFLKSLSTNKLKIISLLDDFLYPAAISRRLHLSRSYVSRFCNELLFKGLIHKEYINPLTRRATSYKLSTELKNHLERIQASKPNTDFTFCIPHYIRYKFPLLKKTHKTPALKTNRFAASKVKLEGEWCMVGGKRYKFSMKHETIGNVGIIVQPNSIIVSQRERYPIVAKSIEDATIIVAMALSDVASRFVQEQRWEGNVCELGTPSLVGSPHYAFSSKIAQRVVAAGNTLLQVGEGLEIDNSLKAKGIKDLSEIETTSYEQADLVDKGLRIAVSLEKDLPNMIKSELKSVADEILGMNAQAEKIDILCNSVQALVRGGIPINANLEQLMGIVARQGESINILQQSMLGIIKNMELIITKSQGDK